MVFQYINRCSYQGKGVTGVCWVVSTIGWRGSFWGFFHGGGRMGRGSTLGDAVRADGIREIYT